MATKDPKIVELQKQLQLAGQNWLPQSGVMDEATRKAIANINKAQGFGKGIGESALTKDTMNYLSKFTPKTTSQTQNNTQTQSTTQPQTATQQQATTETKDNSFYTYLEDLKQAQKQAVIAGLQKAKDSALSNLSAERTTIQPKFYDARNQASANSQLQARNFAEYLAQRGQTNAGVAAQAEINRNADLQGQIGALNRQELQAYEDIARRESDIKNAYASDVANANAGIEANALQQLINQYNTDRNYNLQLGQLLGNINGMPTLQNLAQVAQYTGYYNNLPTLQKQAQDMANQQWQQSYDWQFNPNNPDYLINLEQLKKLQMENKYYPQIIQSQLAQKAKSSSSGSKTSSTSYKTSSDFAADMAYINNNPSTALSEIRANAQALINKYGYDGYLALLNQATALDKQYRNSGE